MPPQSHDYSFILNPERPSRSKLPFFSEDIPPAARAAIVIAGAVILLIIFMVLKSLLGGNSNQPLYLAVLQDQQTIIHLTTEASLSTHKDLPEATRNFVATAKLSITSSQADLKAYLPKIGIKKINPKQLNLKISSQTDKQLITATAAETYPQTLQEVLKTQLADYKRDLSLAYDKTKGSNGRKILAGDYQQAQLLQQQLDAAAAH